jgi:hypothetical protein
MISRYGNQSTGEYLQDMIRDADDIGVGGFPVPDNYDALFRLCRDASTIMSQGIATPLLHMEFTPRTIIGRTALALEGNPGHLEHGVLGRCHETEPKLLESIAPENYTNPNWRSPVILTKKGEPLGVLKAYGIESCYLLTDDPASGMVGGMIVDPNIGLSVKELPTINGVWRLELPENHPVKGMRISTLAVPKAIRQPLYTEYTERLDRVTAGVDHDDIGSFAAEMLPKARPIDPDLAVQGFR